MAFRRSRPPAPRLARQFVHARGLDFAVYTTPQVAGVPPLVCINGGLLYGHALLWPALAPLSQRRQLVLYDQRGRGESKAPPGVRQARLEHDAGDVVAIREALGLREWDVLGHSWGGGIAMLAAEQDRGGVRRLVLVDSVGATSAWLDALRDAALARLDAGERAAFERIDPAELTAPDPEIHSAHSRAIYPAWFADPDLAAMFAPPRASSATGATVAAHLRREGYDWGSRVRAVSAPTLVIHGERDLLPVGVARELASLLVRARLELIPDSGHMPFWEAPERFFALVDAFLSERLPPAPQAE
jgi:proline iminopeptidase